MEGLTTSWEARHTRNEGNASKGEGEGALGRDFERLYRESYSTVYGWVRARMATDADAEDVVADAYLRAARAFSSFDPTRAQFGTWVIAIAKNRMISHYRKARPTSAFEDVPESAFAVESEYETINDLMLIKQLIACLDDDERELIALKYRDGFRNIEIAREMGIKPSTVATKLSRALAKMRAAERSLNRGR